MKILEKYHTDNKIKELIATSSVDNLDLYTLLDLIKNIKEEQKKEYFDNLQNNIIDYEKDFLKIEDTKNLKLLMELFKNNLIPESI